MLRPAAVSMIALLRSPLAQRSAGAAGPAQTGGPLLLLRYSSSSSSSSSDRPASPAAGASTTAAAAAAAAGRPPIPPLATNNATSSAAAASAFPPNFGSNQVLPLETEMITRLNGLLSSFLLYPPTPIQFAFAYGSGVFPQLQAGPEHAVRPLASRAEPAKGKMVDLVLAVNHPQHWHGMNMQHFPNHYSRIARLVGAGSLMRKVQHAGAGVWYHPYVQLNGELAKYGVIDIDTLCKDLLDWDTLYVSGRMHKPVALLLSHPRVRLAQQVNLSSALRTSLLLLPEHFSEVELFTRIASLSYTGDFRMHVPGAENVNKVRNIVLGQRHAFRRLYGGLIRSLGTLDVLESRRDRFTLRQDNSPQRRLEHLIRLPLNLRRHIQAHYTAHPQLDPAFLKLSLSKKSEELRRVEKLPSRDTLDKRMSNSSPSASEDKDSLQERETSAHSRSSDPDTLEFWCAVERQPDLDNVILQSITKIVRGPAWAQSIKGIYTAGLGRTARYVGAKIGKYFEGRSQTQSQPPKGDSPSFSPSPGGKHPSTSTSTPSNSSSSSSSSASSSKQGQ
ncbi:Mitochondrial translocator assembly and maintenance protein 41 [Tilletia horrida]|nr:Mitochondrial translocator assembly and maintenance protein 41 [Tilletia horrida]